MIKHLYDTFANNWYHGGRIFIYSDPHFTDLDSYKFRFPEVFSSDNINKVIYEKIMGKQKADEFFSDASITTAIDKMQIDNINAVCTKNDTLIILGDVGNVECIKKLRAGYKVLITGNHDGGVSNYQRVYKENGIVLQTEDEIQEFTAKGYKLLDSNYTDQETGQSGLLYHKSEDNHLFDEVYEGPVFISEKILLSHEPVVLPFVLNIHGHVHDKTYKSKGINCCAECINYKPICFSDIVSSGILNKIQTIHRTTIDDATKKKKLKTKASE